MRYIIIMVAVMMLASCKSKPLFTEVKDKDLVIQLNAKKDAADSVGLEYHVRIFPEQKVEKTAEIKLKEKMSYGMDSCFYRLKGADKLYPDAVIPIANGVKNCFEYLVVFSDLKVDNLKKDALNYQDKYINGKTYQLMLK